MSNDMKKIISERIRKYMQENNLLERQFADVLRKNGIEVPQSTISSWVMGTREPRTEAKKILFDILGISVENTFHPIEHKAFQVMNNDFLQDEKIDIPLNAHDNLQADYCIIYDREDMQPLINKGDTLFIKDTTANDGDIIIATIDNELTAKRIFKKDNIYTLVSENVNAPPLIYTEEELKKLDIKIVKYILKRV